MMSRAIWAYPQDLVERGADAELAALRRLGFDAVSLAAVYHSVQAYLPENPHRRWLTTLRSQTWFREAPFAAAAEAVRRSGLDLVAWLVLCHSSLATDRPALAMRPAGSPPVPGALCPAQPAVQEHVCAIAAEVDERFSPAALDLETPGWVVLPHHHHGKVGADLGAAERLAAGLCVCDACTRLGARDAYERLRRGALDDPTVTELLRAREQVVTSLVAGVAAAVKTKVRVAHWGDPRPAGIDYAAVTQVADRVTMLAYASDPDVVERTLAPVVAACGADRVTAGLTLCHPEMPEEAAFRACVARCRELGIDSLSLYNHSLVDRARLSWAAD